MPTSPAWAIGAGFIAIGSGLCLLTAALAWSALGLFVCATLVGGVGAGLAFLGCLQWANSMAPPGRRGQVLSTFFLLSVGGLIIPVVGFGVAAQSLGDLGAAVAGTGFVVLTLAASGGLTLRALATPLRQG